MKVTGVYLNKEDAVLYIQKLREANIETELKQDPKTKRWVVYSEAILATGIVLEKKEKEG